MDFEGAIQAHVAWKGRLLAYVNGGGEALDAGVVGRDDACALGKWIHSEGARYAGRLSFATVKSHHATFHRAAADVVRAAQSGDKAKALALIDGPAYVRASADTIAAIRALQESIKSAA